MPVAQVEVRPEVDAKDAESWPVLSFLDDGASMSFDQLCLALELNPTAAKDSFMSQYGEGLKMAAFHLKNQDKGVSFSRPLRHSRCAWQWTTAACIGLPIKTVLCMQAIFLFARTPTERTVALLGGNCKGKIVTYLLRLPQKLRSGQPCSVEALQLMMVEEGLLDKAGQDSLFRPLRQLTRSRTHVGYGGNMRSPFDTFNDFCKVITATAPDSSGMPLVCNVRYSLCQACFRVGVGRPERPTAGCAFHF